jgi:hypothetical protein
MGGSLPERFSDHSPDGQGSDRSAQRCFPEFTTEVGLEAKPLLYPNVRRSMEPKRVLDFNEVRAIVPNSG